MTGVGSAEPTVALPLTVKRWVTQSLHPPYKDWREARKKYRERLYSAGNRQRRPRKGRRYGKYKHARKRCHCFVMGLLLTPSGMRIPFRRCYYNLEHCKKKEWTYRKQTDLAAEMIRELPLPKDADGSCWATRRSMPK